MLVLAAVRPSMLARLRHAAGHRFQFHPVTGWDEGVRAVLRRPVEIAVVDPSLEGAARAQGIQRLHALFPSLPIIVYTGLSPDLRPGPLRRSAWSRPPEGAPRRADALTPASLPGTTPNARAGSTR